MDEKKPPEEMKRFESNVDMLARLQNEAWKVDGPDQAEEFRASIDEGAGEDRSAGSPSPGRPPLRSLLADLGSFTQPSILIGSCEDGLPVLIDLANSQAGSTLILGGPGSGKTALLLSILTSTCLINTPRKVRYACISSKPGELEPVLSAPHCYRFSDPDESQAVEIVRELADLAAQRRLGKGLGPAILLGIDGLDKFLNELEEEEAQRLFWLIKEGPASQVWTVATLDASRAGRQGASLVDIFNTWLIGRIEPAHQQALSARIQSARPDQLICGVQFCALFENEWLRFWVPSV